MDRKINLNVSWSKLLSFLWIAALVTLPYTSFPLLVRLSGAITSPLAAVPVILLLLLGVLPFLLKRGQMPRETLPFVVFILVILLASAAAFFLDIPSFKSKTVLGQEIRAFATLGIGVAFYLLFAIWPNSPERLKKAIFWINIGGMVMLAWTLLQSYFIFLHYQRYPDWMLVLQKYILVQSPYFTARQNRVTGLTYEASWYAHQIVILYLPLWLAAVYHRASAFSFRILRLPVEAFLLVLGLITFFYTSPRISLASLLLIAVFIFAKINLAIIRKAVNTILSFKKIARRGLDRRVQVLLSIAISLVIFAIYAVGFFEVIRFAGGRDWRLALVLQKPPSLTEIQAALTLDETTLLSLGWRLAFLERVAYWVTGWRIFNLHPWLGVGLGNSGFYFLQQMPAIGFSTFEIRALLFDSQNLPNIKSMWVRLLAEGGLAGFSVFLTWLWLLWRSARNTYRSADPFLKSLALAGQLSLVVFLIEGFNLDSFAMPYLWVIAGLISAAGLIFRCSPPNEKGAG